MKINPSFLSNILESLSSVHSVMEKSKELGKNFEQGYAVDNPAKLKKRAIILGLITSILSMLVGMGILWGFDLGFTTETIAVLSSIVVTVIELTHSIVHTITSKKVGLKPKPSELEDKNNDIISN